MLRSDVLTACGALALVFILSCPVICLSDESAAVNAELPVTTLRIGFMQKVDSLNPFVGITDTSYIFYGLVYDALTCVDENLKASPNLALSTWAVPSTDPQLLATGEPYGSVWQYNLTMNAYWSDGEPFTADDVVWNINLNTYNFADLWAYQPYLYFANYAEKTDDSTVRVHFYDRSSQEPKAASYAYDLPIYMLPRHKLMSYTPSFLGYAWTGMFEGEPNPIVGTGPFMATSALYSDWLSGNPITLVRNPNYHFWADYQKRVYVDRIQLKFYDDSLAMRYALESGQLDIASFPPQMYLGLEQDIAAGRASIQTYDGPKVNQYWTEIGVCNMPNSKNPSRMDPVVRHAMAMATNKTYIVQNFYLGFADEGETVIPPINTFWHYSPTADEKFKFDLGAAGALLQSNGYIDTNGDEIREATATSPAVLNNWVSAGTPLSYEMLVRAEYPEEKEIAKFLKSQWNQVGIDFTYIVVDESVIPSFVYSYEWDLMIWYWSADIDPNYQLFVATSMAISGWNDIWYHNAAYDENYTDSVSAMDPTVRKSYVDNCQRIIYGDCNYLVIAYPYQTYAWRTDTFAGWGDWSRYPGRSLDNYWTANPLFFDLSPSWSDVSLPTDLSLSAPSRAKLYSNVTFDARAKQAIGYPLQFQIEFGDGFSEIQVADGGTGWQTVEFTHSYSATGVYVATVWVSAGGGAALAVNTTRTVVVSEGEPYSTTYAAIGAGVAAAAVAAVLLLQGMRKRGKVIHELHRW